MRRFSSYEVSNFIVKLCVDENVKINNLKLNGIIAFIYYNSKRVHGWHFTIDPPKRNSNFYLVKDVYNRFRHMGVEPIRFLPSDFDFTTLLLGDFDPVNIRRHSHEMLEGIERVKVSMGNYIELIVGELSRQDVFSIVETVDLERDLLYEKRLNWHL